MRALVQRVSTASVVVANKEIAKINSGLLVLVGITHTDTTHTANWIAEKLVQLRVFPDSDGKMNNNVVDTNGSILLVSQFTLYGNLKKGTRPSFIEAAPADAAKHLFDYLVTRVHNVLPESYPANAVQQGIFGADMKVSLINDGPVTILLEQ